MANIIFSRKELESLIGEITKDIEEKITLFGTPLERINENEVEIEIFPNRPDLLSVQGFSRSFKAFLGKSPGLTKYKINKPEKDFTIKISPTVKEIRPYTVCAIVKDLNLTDERIKSIIDLQDCLLYTSPSPRDS